METNTPSRIRLMFTEDELPVLVALAKTSKGTTRAVIMLGNSGTLRERGPVGGFATEDQRLAKELEGMLEQLIIDKKDKAWETTESQAETKQSEPPVNTKQSEPQVATKQEEPKS